MCNLNNEIVLSPDLGEGRIHMDPSTAIGVAMVIVILIGLLGSIVYLFCMKHAKSKQTPTADVPMTTKMHAAVVDLCCAVRTMGYKQPKTVKLFAVTFETADGQRIQLKVPEEMYEGFEKGQMGLLTLVDGELYSFELSEN